MSQRNSSPDWFARILSVVSFLAVVYIAVLNYQDNHSERILAHIQGLRERSIQESTGKLSVEVTNLGLHTVYLKNIQLNASPLERDSVLERGTFVFFSHDPVVGSAKRVAKIVGTQSICGLSDPPGTL
jgi:hypothetical protein